MNENNEVAVRFKSISKSFPFVQANDKISLEIKKGTIHALLGENGAGKTTLVKILYGLYQADKGQIYIGEKLAEIKSPNDAISLGVGMVHQHFTLIQRHTVAENITLGVQNAPLIKTAEKAESGIRALSEKFGFKIKPNSKVWQLSAGEKQQVEIMKALYRGAQVLILDEPTSVLTPQETKQLFSTLKAMKKEGKTVIFITHKLNEVKQVSDKVTVLRNGKVVGSFATSSVTRERLAEEMVGRKVIFDFEKEELEKENTLLKVDNIYSSSKIGAAALRGVSFQIKEKEILGVAGVAGNGQKELAQILAGLSKSEKGEIYLNGVEVTNPSPLQLLRLGLAYIPEERHLGYIKKMEVAENLVVKKHDFSPFSRGVFLNKKAIIQNAQSLVAQYQVITPSVHAPAGNLSGGNLQRLILARELSGKPKIIIAAYPTSGLDVAAQEQIRENLLCERKRGAAILLISEDLDEIMALSDRIMVLFEGKIMGIVSPEQTTKKEVGLMMAGEQKKEVKANEPAPKP